MRERVRNSICIVAAAVVVLLAAGLPILPGRPAQQRPSTATRGDSNPAEQSLLETEHDTACRAVDVGARSSVPVPRETEPVLEHELERLFDPKISKRDIVARLVHHRRPLPDGSVRYRVHEEEEFGFTVTVPEEATEAYRALQDDYFERLRDHFDPVRRLVVDAIARDLESSGVEWPGGPQAFVQALDVETRRHESGFNQKGTFAFSLEAPLDDEGSEVVRFDFDPEDHEVLFMTLQEVWQIQAQRHWEQASFLFAYR